MADTTPRATPTAGIVGSGRQWLVTTPPGCDVPALADVVFLGTVIDADFQTARFRVEQLRAGDVAPFSYGDLVDIRYGADTKNLNTGTQYLVGASRDGATGMLRSKVSETEPFFAGDDVIGVAETDVSCPQLADPVRTLGVDGKPVDASVLGPLGDAKGDLLRAIVLPLVIAVAVVFALASIRWLITGVGKGVGSVVGTARQTREVRAATRDRRD